MPQVPSTDKDGRVYPEPLTQGLTHFADALKARKLPVTLSIPSTLPAGMPAAPPNPSIHRWRNHPHPSTTLEVAPSNPPDEPSYQLHQRDTCPWYPHAKAPQSKTLGTRYGGEGTPAEPHPGNSPPAIPSPPAQPSQGV